MYINILDKLIVNPFHKLLTVEALLEWFTNRASGFWGIGHKLAQIFLRFAVIEHQVITQEYIVILRSAAQSRQVLWSG